MRNFWIAVFLAYGTITTVFTALEEGAWTQDEGAYRKAGLIYLNERSFHERNGHPPFSSVLGATLPYAIGSTHPVLFRIPHVALYLVVGILLVVLMARKYGSAAALVLSVLYGTCPNLKAMAALHVNDSDLALLTGLGALLAIQKRAALAGFALGFAACAKVTGLLFQPLAVITLLIQKQPVRRYLGATTLAVLISYLVSVPDQYWIWPLIFQVRHAAEGHGSTIFGNASPSGFWYYFFVHYLFKTSIAAHGVLTVGAVCLWKHRRRMRLEFGWTVALPLVFLLLLSFGKVHIGYRYFLPGLVLAYLGAGVAWGSLLEKKERSATVAFSVLAVALLAEDFQTVKWNSYLAYFSPLTPSPTKNFSDSSIDWGQDLQKRFYRRMPSPMSGYGFTFRDAFAKPMDAPFQLVWGASSLSGQFGWPPGRWLYPRPPEGVIAGHEIHHLTPRKLYAYLRAQYPPKNCLNCDLVIQNKSSSECGTPFLQGVGTTDEYLCWVDSAAKVKLGPNVARVRDPQ